MAGKHLTPKQSLNKAYLKTSITNTQLRDLTNGLIALSSHIKEGESEEYHKNLISDFLKTTFYGGSYFINTKGRNDLVIHNGADAKSSVGVIVEAKSPSNKAEMIRLDSLNGKALQELVLYYLRERIANKNMEVKHLIATNLHEWFVFDAALFDRLFAHNKSLVKKFEAFEAKELSVTNTSDFYNDIAKPAIEEVMPSLEFTYINLGDYVKLASKVDVLQPDSKGVKDLATLYKFFSPQHLLKLKVANDSNSLNKEFYNELLYILGLEQASEGSKKIIRRCEPQSRQRASLVENTITSLDSHEKITRLIKPSSFGGSYQEQLFNVTLELIITWINRVLFLKLLESQLVSYHKGDREYRFLNYEKIKDFDDLDKLFFRVLARKVADRDDDINALFGRVPYLNSSLFEPTELEHQTIFVNGLEDFKLLPIYSGSVLKDASGKRRAGSLATLEYLFEFLDAYNFASEGADEIRHDSKALISASVLGLIFEKINGYKDGSFFTPAFITMYMCRETIRRAVVQKFNEVKGWQCNVLDDLYNKIDDPVEASGIINSIKICDPAVGSGHFLVSALNELVAIKSDLQVLFDRQGRRLKQYRIEVVNDELLVTDDEGDIFEYNPKNPESQRVQETLFHEKQTIIENCLFGVDINPNSVKICRLRLWIELLKNAYYKAPGFTELETLPNIDINIKCGNSLVSRYPLDVDLRAVLKAKKYSVDSYRLAVQTYKHAASKEQKREMEQLILLIKQEFTSVIGRNDPLKTRLDKLAHELYNRFTGNFLFEPAESYGSEKKKVDKTLSAEQQKLEKEIEVLTKKVLEIKNNRIYENAFEWRFEFPEVLNDEGDFLGFDVVIGNPPYIRQEEIKEIKPLLQQNFSVYSGTSDLYVFFVELGFSILKPNGNFSFIMPSKWMQAGYGKPLREYLSQKGVDEIVDFGDLQVFDGATTYPCIVSIQNCDANPTISAAVVGTLQFGTSFSDYVKGVVNEIPSSNLGADTWVISSADDRNLLVRLNKQFLKLDEYTKGTSYRGVITGLTEAFIIDENKASELIAEDASSISLLKPVLRGRDVQRWAAKPNSMWLVGTFPALKLDIENYSAVKKYFEGVGIAKLEQSGKAGSRKKTSFKWFETQDSIAYWEEFEKPKIMYQVMQVKPCFIYDDQGAYCNNSMWIIPKDDKVLLAILNSKMGWWLISKYCTAIQNGYQLIWKYFGQVPIAAASDAQRVEMEAIVNEIIALKKQDADTTALESQIDQLVYQLYGLTEEEIAIVEGRC